jgi:hypothetical protein
MKVLSEQSNLRSIFKWIGRFAVAAVFLAGYVWLTVSYTNQKICTSRYSFVAEYSIYCIMYSGYAQNL